MAPRLTHIALHVRDIEACRAFYESLCGMRVVHDRTSDEGVRVLWLAEPGRERELVFVLISGGAERPAVARDVGHLGFALPSRAAVDQVADRARAQGVLVWEPRQDPYPAGYYCGVRDPNGAMVEFSYGQPLGPGADESG